MCSSSSMYPLHSFVSYLIPSCDVRLATSSCVSLLFLKVDNRADPGIDPCCISAIPGQDTRGR